MAFAISVVNPLVVPAAPYVTLINAGLSFTISSTTFLVFAILSHRLGGKTSNETVTFLLFIISLIFIITTRFLTNTYFSRHYTTVLVGIQEDFTLYSL